MEQIIDSKTSTKKKSAQKHWFTPKVAALVKKISTEKWFVSEVIYPKEVPGCEIFDYNNCMRLYHNKARFFAMNNERLNTEIGKYCNLNIDFVSAEKIIIRQPDETAFDKWNNGEQFELTSLWPGRQLVVAANHTTRQLLAFAPIFVVSTPEFRSTSDLERFYEFEKEFKLSRKHLETRQIKVLHSETPDFLQNSYNLLIWLKNHCY